MADRYVGIIDDATKEPLATVYMDPIPERGDRMKLRIKRNWRSFVVVEREWDTHYGFVTLWVRA